MALLAILTGLLLWIGSIFGRNGLIMAGAFALLINFGSYYFSDKIVLFIYRAKPADKKNHAKLFSIVEELSRKAEIPMPKLYIVPSQTPNAFATGRNPKHSAVACTEGILGLLTEKELKGVLAHELSHVKNRDTLIQTIAATIAGVISYLATMLRFGAMFGGNNDRNGNNNLLGLIFIAILAPIIALLIQLAISRSREYMADETGARLVKDHAGLASALEKLERGVKYNPLSFGNEATSSLFIVNPFKASVLLSLFSTHPPVSERVKRLKELDL